MDTKIKLEFFIILMICLAGVLKGDPTWAEDPAMVDAVNRIGSSLLFKYIISPKDDECFYEQVDKGTHIYVTYSVSTFIYIV